MTDQWGERELSDGPTPPAPTPMAQPVTPPRPRGGRLTSPTIVVVGVILATGFIALGWWVLAGTFREEPEAEGDNPSLPIGAPLVPGAGAAKAGNLVACITESNAITTAKKAAAVSKQAGLEDSARGYLAEPDGEFFSVAEDDTVTTLEPLPPGCPIP